MRPMRFACQMIVMFAPMFMSVMMIIMVRMLMRMCHFAVAMFVRMGVLMFVGQMHIEFSPGNRSPFLP